MLNAKTQVYQRRFGFLINKIIFRSNICRFNNVFRLGISTCLTRKQEWLGQRLVLVGVVGNTSLLACWHWPNIGPTLQIQQFKYCCCPKRWHYNYAPSRLDEQNDNGPTLFVNVEPTILPSKCQRWPKEGLLSGCTSRSTQLNPHSMCSAFNIKKFEPNLIFF